MDETFELPVTWKGTERLFPARMLQTGYSFRIEVDIDGHLILFEPDEERQWRAVVHWDAEKKPDIPVDLLQAIATTLEELTR